MASPSPSPETRLVTVLRFTDFGLPLQDSANSLNFAHVVGELGNVFGAKVSLATNHSISVLICIQIQMGYWRQRADDRLGDSPPKVHPEAFSGYRQGWEDSKMTPWQCTASMRVAGVHCWEISLG